ncbi:MAG: SlyX family protein [Pseudomonadota bacterium]
MDARINDLEVKLAFQDDLLEALNHSVAQQQQQIDLLQAQMRMLYQQMKTLQPSDQAVEADEPPPPHY